MVRWLELDEIAHYRAICTKRASIDFQVASPGWQHTNADRLPSPRFSRVRWTERERDATDACVF